MIITMTINTPLFDTEIEQAKQKIKAIFKGAKIKRFIVEKNKTYTRFVFETTRARTRELLQRPRKPLVKELTKIIQEDLGAYGTIEIDNTKHRRKTGFKEKIVVEP